MYTQWRQIQLNERSHGAQRIHTLVRLAKNWLYPLYDAQSTVHFEQRGAARSPTTLTLSMLHARTLPLLACRNHPCSPNLGKCHRASPDCTLGGANWALAVPFVLSEDTAPMIVPMPTRAAPSTSCFIGGVSFGVRVFHGLYHGKSLPTISS